MAIAAMGGLCWFIFSFCVEVASCLGITSLVVFWVVFGCGFVFFGAFGSGWRRFLSLVFMALCCVVVVVVVNACCVYLEFHWLCCGVAFFCFFGLEDGLGFGVVGEQVNFC
jgi:hypothetical protein